MSLPVIAQAVTRTALAAGTTNTPVWALVVVTAALVVVTLGLVAAAWKALEQVRTAVDELDEVKRDRQVQVFAEFSRRWDEREMTESLALANYYTAEGLADFFGRPQIKCSGNPFRERTRKRQALDRFILLRVPNYFEDLMAISSTGKLERKLLHDNFGGVAIEQWSLWGPAIKTIQRETDSLAFVEFERLALEAAQEDEERDEPVTGAASGRASPEDQSTDENASSRSAS